MLATVPSGKSIEVDSLSLCVWVCVTSSLFEFRFLLFSFSSFGGLSGICVLSPYEFTNYRD
jgi:hypothetical protein